MTFTINPTSAETARGCQALAFKSLPSNKSGLVLGAIYVLTFLVATFLIPQASLSAFLLAVGTTTVALLGIQTEARRRIARGRAADPHALEPYQVELSSEGLRTWCAHIETRYTWGAIRLMADSPEFLLFVHGVGGGLFLPKRLLSEADLAGIRQDVAKWAPGLATA